MNDLIQRNGIGRIAGKRLLIDVDADAADGIVQLQSVTPTSINVPLILQSRQ